MDKELEKIINDFQMDTKKYRNKLLELTDGDSSVEALLYKAIKSIEKAYHIDSKKEVA